MRVLLAGPVALSLLVACGTWSQPGESSETALANHEAEIAQLASQMRASPELRATGRTLRVPSEFATIASAIAAATPGDEVRVSAGTYGECLVLVDGVILSGEEGATLDGSGCVSTATCHGVVCGGSDIIHGATVRGFQIVNADDGIDLEGSQNVHVFDVLVAAPARRGIFASGAIGLGVSKLHVVGARAGGLGLRAGTTAELEDLNVEGSSGAAVRSLSKSSFVLKNATFTNNGGGVVITEGSRAALIGNNIQGRGIGISVTPGLSFNDPEAAPSTVWLLGNVVHDNDNSGIWLKGKGASGKGARNGFVRNLYGIQITGGAEYAGWGDTAVANRDHGVSILGCDLNGPNIVQEQSRVTLHTAILSKNLGQGVSAGCGGIVALYDTLSTGNPNGAVAVSNIELNGQTVSVPSSIRARGSIFASSTQGWGVIGYDSFLDLGSLTDRGLNSFLSNPAGSIANISTNPVPAQWNWFGTTDPNGIASWIVDCSDDPNFGCVQFVPFLNRAPNPPPGVWPPAGTVAVNFSVDDSANRVYGPGDLKWKGSFSFDPITRLLTFDPFWSAGVDGWPTLHDDGPWTEGGHEPIGARAGDHLWGVTVFVTPPAAGSQTYEYGAIDVLYETTLGNGWIWKGPNGSFVVDAGARAPITASGMSVEKFGHTDLQFLLDTTKLAQFPGWTWDTSRVTVKSSAWGWGELAMQDVGAGLRSFQLSAFAGKHNLLVHTGLLNPGDQPEFVFVIGGVEYRNWWGDFRVLADGVTASIGPQGGHHYTPVPIWWTDALNTAITVPGHHD